MVLRSKETSTFFLHCQFLVGGGWGLHSDLCLVGPLALSALWGRVCGLCPGSAARHAPRLPGFILLGGFGGAFLVVSILGVVYDCHLSAVLQSWGSYWWFLLGIWVLFGLGLALSVLWGSLWAVSKVDRSARAPCLQRFILLGSFSDTLLVVSILDIVYDCHL